MCIVHSDIESKELFAVGYYGYEANIMCMLYVH